MLHSTSTLGPGPGAAQRSQSSGTLVSAWLTDLPYRWQPLDDHGRIRHVAKDETLFLEGQPADTVFAVVDGRIRLTSFGFDGHERHLMIIGANGLVGDCAMVSSPNYVVSAVAAADSVLRAIPMPTLVAALAHDALMLRQHHELSGMRFRIMLRHLAMQGSNSGRRRVCLHLLDLVNSYGIPHPAGSAISITFTQQEMGSICGLSRVSVSNVFTALERDDVITRSGRLVARVPAAALFLS